MIKVHVKNNHHAPGSFPNTPEGEQVFTITRARFEQAAEDWPALRKQLDVFIDWDTDHFVESMADTEILIAWNLPTENLGRIAPELKWIHIIGAGVEHLTPMNWLPDGAVLTNNKGAHAEKGGEFGLMSLLMLHNAVPTLFTNQRQAVYDSIYSTPIAGKTVVVVGMGSIGRSVAVRAAELGMRVIGVSRHGRPVAGVDEVCAVQAIDSVLPLADYVFVVTPLTEETRNLISRQRLERLKPGAGLVNIGRAPVVDYDALSEMLYSGRLGGAVLDVFDEEPLPQDSPLWKVPNLLVTPHVSADDGNAYVPMTLGLFFENLERYVQGIPLENQVNASLGY